MVRIITGAAAGARTIEMPTETESRQLRKIVFAQYPRLDPGRDGEASYRADLYEQEFRAAFFALGHMGRLAEPETKNPRHLSWWAGYATDILRDFGREVEVNGRTLAVACLAWGDVPHTIGPRFPFDVSLGLTYQHAGTPSGDGWRRVISTGKLRPASALPATRDYRPGIVRLDVPSDTLRVGLVGSSSR